MTGSVAGGAEPLQSMEAGGFSWFVLRAIGIASLGGILFGYDMGVVSGALPQLKAAFELTEVQQGRVVSFLYLGGGIGAAVGGTLCDVAGRKTAILLTDLVFMAGAGTLFWSDSIRWLLAGRFVVGWAVAVSGIADVAYLHEIGPLHRRGAVVSVNEACISLGFLLAYLAGYTLSHRFNGWRIMFGISAIIAFLQFTGMLFMPESPVWLKEQTLHQPPDIANGTQKGPHGDDSNPPFNNGAHISEPEPSLVGYELHHKLETTPTVLFSPHAGGEQHAKYDSVLVNEEPTITTIRKPMMVTVDSIFGAVVQSSNVVSIRLSVVQFLQQIRIYHRQSIIAIFLSIVQQFCGNTVVLNFAPEIFSQVGMTSTSLFSTVLLGALKFVVTCLVIWKIERTGRRFLLLLGTGIIALSLLLLSIAYSNLDKTAGMPAGMKYLALIGVFGVVLGYSVSFGPLTWLLTSEMFPPRIRGRALAASTIVTYLAASTVSYTFLSGQAAFGPSVPFAIYCTITALSFCFAFVSIPETSDKSPEEIDVEIMQMWLWRRPSRHTELTRPIKLSPAVDTTGLMA